MEYSKRLRAAREDADITQREAGEAVGTTQQQINKYENGLQDMSITRLMQFCKLYNVSADYILGLPKDSKWPR